jgi:putative sterol carrier protein
MSEATREFFESLAAREHEPLLGRVSGTLRVDLRAREGLERWFVRMSEGEVAVSHRRAKADCVVTMDEALFDRIVTGEANAIAATLRGEIELEGQPGVVLAFQRLFPGPPTQVERRSAGYARRQR